jgi:glycosyltransferase involved in cell wall biosynthesis
MAQELTRRGHRVTLLIAPYDNLSHAGRVEDLDGVNTINLPLKRVTTWTPLLAAWQLAAHARRLQPGTVHIFKPVGYAALAGMILRHIYRLPIVTDTDDWEGTGGWNSVNPYPWHWRRFFDFQERWLPRHSAAVTVASRTLQTQMWGMGVPPRRVLYVPNCPSATLLSYCGQVGEASKAKVRQALGVGDAPLAMYVGNITLGDDLDIALLALKQVLERIPEARLAIVGAGAGLARLRSFAADLALERAVTFAGWIDHQDVPAYLAAADVAIYPYRDTLINRAKCSIKVLEYMAMGKAIVTSRVGQNTEYIEHGKSGILVEPGNADTFANGLITVLAEPSFGRRLGAQARERIEHTFNWSKHIIAVEQAYRLACPE